MFNISRAKPYFYLGLLGLAYAPTAFAADTAAEQPYTWTMCHGMHGHYFWWVFPLLLFIMLAVIFFHDGKMREALHLVQQQDDG